MTLYYADNTGLSTTTGIQAGQSFATGAKVALQLGVPSGGFIRLCEWGISMDGSAAATPALLELAVTATSTTMTTGHTTTTVQPYDDASAPASRLTMGTTATGYGNPAITSNTTLSMADRQYIPPTGQYVKMWPYPWWPEIGNSSAARYLQFRINTSATVDAIIYAIWEERI